MYELEFNVTSYCQAKCVSCLRTLLDKQGLLVKKHTPLDYFTKAIKNIPENVYITLCGETGDPMMHPDIELILDAFVSNNNPVSIHTNGGLRDKEFYKKYASHDKINFQFGIDGLDEKTNSMYRDGVDFNRAWENMHAWFSTVKELNRESYAGEWSFIVFSWNSHQIESVHKYAKKMGIPLVIKINNRVEGYVGDSEYKRIKELINELE